jgi:hypothetical protein
VLVLGSPRANAMVNTCQDGVSEPANTANIDTYLWMFRLTINYGRSVPAE